MAMLNPLNKIPVFLAETKQFSPKLRRGLAVTLSVAVFVMLVISYFAGRFILQIFSISLPAFQIAGGLVIIVYGLRMTLEKTVIPDVGDEEDDGFSYDFDEAGRHLGEIIVPLGVPLIVGPGTMTTVILYSDIVTDFGGLIFFHLLMLVGTVITGVVLLFSDPIRQRLGKNGLEIMTRIMGLLLIAIAIQFILDGTGAAASTWLSAGLSSILNGTVPA
ncbi:MarC family protein [Methanogenium cariaci]|jgi:multiple antibiotic resistance protein